MRGWLCAGGIALGDTYSLGDYFPEQLELRWVPIVSEGPLCGTPTLNATNQKMTKTSSAEEREAAYRESGRAVAVALIGFTLQTVSVLPTSDASSAGSTSTGFTAFKERSDATLEELTFIAAAGIWSESLAFPDEQDIDIESILARLNLDRARIDIGKMGFGLAYLKKNYRASVLRIAQRLLEKKIMNGIECGQIILAERPIPEKRM